MDDSVFSSQFQAMRDAFAREGVDIEVAYTPSGRADYIYETGRLLAQQEVGRADPGGVSQDIALVDQDGISPGWNRCKVLSIDNCDDGSLTVPQALDIIDGAAQGRQPGAGRRLPAGHAGAHPAHHPD